MKRVFSLMLLLASVAVVSCDTDDSIEDQEQEQAVPTTYTDASGAEVTLGSYLNYQGTTTDGVYIADGDSSSSIAFYTDDLLAGYTCSYNADWMSWNGFAISTNLTTSVTVESYEGSANYDYEFMAYASADADDDSTFVVGYYSAYYSDDYPGFTPTIKFSTPSNLASVSIAPAAIVASYCTQTLYDWSTSEPLTDPDYTLTVTVVGYDSSSNEVATTSVDLADVDFEILTDWTTLDLSDFDGVSSLAFYVSCEDYYAPTYFCIDALVFE